MCRFSIPVIAFSLLFLTGCSSDFWNVGESNFTCEDVPTGFGCASTMEAYRRTGGSIESIETSNPHRASAVEVPEGGNYPPLPETNMALALAPEPSYGTSKIPIRTPAKILRVWIAPFEGKHGALYMPGLVYREIQPRTWQVGHENQTITHHSSPLTESKRN